MTNKETWEEEFELLDIILKFKQSDKKNIKDFIQQQLDSQKASLIQKLIDKVEGMKQDKPNWDISIPMIRAIGKMDAHNEAIDHVINILKK